MLGLLLFLPSKNYIFFYSISIIFLFLLIPKKSISKKQVQFFTYTVLYLIICLLIRVFNFGFYVITDLLDIVRVIMPLLILLVAFQSCHKDIMKILALYLIVDFFVSLIQFFSIDVPFIENLNNYYVASSNSILLERDNVRALGISPGVAQHGAIYSMFFSYWLILFYKGYDKKISIFFLLISLTGLLITQSKTSLISSAVCLVIISFIFLSNKKFKLRPVIILMLVSFIMVSLTPFLIDNLYQFEKLFLILSSGITPSSVEARFIIWSDFLNYLSEKPVLLLFGAGRELVSGLGSTFDNDYVFILTTFGLLFFVLFYFLLLSVPLFYGFDKKTYYSYMVNVFILSLFTSPISSPMVIALLILHLRVLYVERKNY